jgi:hypothetical protein
MTNGGANPGAFTAAAAKIYGLQSNRFVRYISTPRVAKDRFFVWLHPFGVA